MNIIVNVIISYTTINAILGDSLQAIFKLYLVRFF